MQTATEAGRIVTPGRHRAGTPALVALCLTVILAAAMLWAMTIGTLPLSPVEIGSALFAFEGSHDQLAVVSVRLPRVLAGAAVGAALAASGALMQAITGNPLASPGLMGVSAGAAFTVVVAIVTGAGRTSADYVGFGFGGGLVAALLVFAVTMIGPGRGSPLKLVLAGAVLSSFLGAATGAMLLFDRQALDQVRFWMVGSLAGRQMDGVLGTLPYILAGLAAALAAGRQVMVLAFGDDTASALGQNVLLWRLLATMIGVLLAAAAVSLAGPVGFVGLIVPHVMRIVAGARFGWLLLLCALGGALLVVFADGASRVLAGYREIPVGVAMAVIGAPFFVYLAAFKVKAR